MVNLRQRGRLAERRAAGLHELGGGRQIGRCLVVPAGQGLAFSAAQSLYCMPLLEWLPTVRPPICGWTSL